MELNYALNITTDRILCDVVAADTTELNADIATVFKDCSADETYLMFAIAENLKQTLKLKKFI